MTTINVESRPILRIPRLIQIVRATFVSLSLGLYLEALPSFPLRPSGANERKRVRRCSSRPIVIYVFWYGCLAADVRSRSRNLLLRRFDLIYVWTPWNFSKARIVAYVRAIAFTPFSFFLRKENFHFDAWLEFEWIRSLKIPSSPDVQRIVSTGIGDKEIERKKKLSLFPQVKYVYRIRSRAIRRGTITPANELFGCSFASANSSSRFNSSSVWHTSSIYLVNAHCDIVFQFCCEFLTKRDKSKRERAIVINAIIDSHRRSSETNSEDSRFAQRRFNFFALLSALSSSFFSPVFFPLFLIVRRQDWSPAST